MASRLPAFYATLHRRFFQPGRLQPGLLLLWLWWVPAVAALFLAPSTAAAKAIGCTHTSLNNSAQAVCASASLRALAAGIDKRYPRVAGNAGVRQNQLEWIGVRDRCNGNLACLTTAYRERSVYLAALPLKPIPAIESDSSRASLRHLFPRHASAQLLIPAVARRQQMFVDNMSATDMLDRAAGPLPMVGHDRWNPLWLMTVILCAAVLMWQMLTNVCGKCPNCHHWFAKVEIDQSNFATAPPTTSVRLLDGLRKRAITNAFFEPPFMRGRAATVRHYYRCRLCLHEWETTSRETLQPADRR